MVGIPFQTEISLECSTIIIIVIIGKDLSKELGFRMPVHLLYRQVNREEFFLLFNVKIIGQVYELAPSKNIAIIS